MKEIKIDTLYDALLLFIGTVIGMIATIFILSHFWISPLKEEQKRVAAVNEVITNASFLCGIWKVGEKTFDRNGNLLYLTLTALDRSERVLIIPLDFDRELLRAWNKKEKGALVEVVISSWRINEYLQKGGNRPRPIDLVEPDSINDLPVIKKPLR